MAEFSRKAQKNGEFYTPDFPLFYNIIKAMLDSEDGNEKYKINTVLGKLVREKNIMTLTKIPYKTKKRDRIIHNYGMDDSYFGEVDFVGMNDYIKNLSDVEVYQTLLGTKDSISEIDFIVKWISGRDTYIYRPNSKPDNLDERIGGFGSGYVTTGFGFYQNPNDAYWSLGIRPSREN